MATATKTDPKKWEQAKEDAKARMGGKHSARAMQLATQLYKKRGGGYSGKKPTAKSNSLKKWTKQKWKWSGGSKDKGVYLPSDKVERLKSSKEGKKKLRAAGRKKSKATREGRQYSSHGLASGTSLKKKEASMNSSFFSAFVDELSKIAGAQRDWAFGKGRLSAPKEPPPKGVAMTPRYPQVPIVDPISGRIFSHKERHRLQSLPKKLRGPSWKDTEPANQQPGMPGGPVLRPKTDAYFWSGKGGGKHAK